MSADRIPVIIDTDPGVDDTIAILLALASPELEILAITVTFGNTDVEHSYENILKLWHVLHKHFEKHPEDSHRFPIFDPDFQGHIPFLARGSESPLDGERYNAQHYHGRDGLSDISTRHPEFSILHGWESSRLRLTDKSAVELSLDLIERYPTREITYIALGPLTNLARMMRKDAALVRDKIGRVVVMGGTLETAGNVTAVAEFNFYADPYAVRALLDPLSPSFGLPLNRFVLLPLDITTKHALTFPDYKKIVDPAFGSTTSPSRPEGKSPLVHFVSSFLEQTAEVTRSFGEDVLELHDIVAVWCVICNPLKLDEDGDGPLLTNGWMAQKRRFQIERAGEFTRGMLVVDRRKHKIGDNREGQLKNIHEGVVEVEPKAHAEELLMNAPEVAVVTHTPGQFTLLRLIMGRIWGLQL